nr:expressed conserved protein [Hymenolepis microstoma]
MEFRPCWIVLFALGVLVCSVQAKTCGTTHCEDKSGFFWDVSCCKKPDKTCCYERRWWPLITTICCAVALIVIFCCICYCCPCCQCLASCGKNMCKCCSKCCKDDSPEHKPLNT